MATDEEILAAGEATRQAAHKGALEARKAALVEELAKIEEDIKHLAAPVEAKVENVVTEVKAEAAKVEAEVENLIGKAPAKEEAPASVEETPAKTEEAPVDDAKS